MIDFLKQGRTCLSLGLASLLIACEGGIESTGKNNTLSEPTSSIKLLAEKKQSFRFPEKSLFIALDGKDDQAGSEQSPWRNLSSALKRAKGGETIFLRGGRYRVNVNLRKAVFEKQVTVRNYPGEEVVFEGTQNLSSNWQEWKQGIYKTVLENDVWQLFSGSDLVYVARWPDARFEDDTIWRMTQSMRSLNGGFRKGNYTGKSRFGLAYDEDFKQHDGTGFYEGDSRYEVKDQPESLAESSVDFTGALAVLNIGHWMTWARPILKHSAGSDHFTYDTSGFSEEDLKAHSAYYILGLQALDRPNEWWFDHKTKELYYMPPSGKRPSEMNLAARDQHFGLNLLKCKNLKFHGIEFFATGFNIVESEQIDFMDCQFSYASTNQYVLARYDWFNQRNMGTNSRASAFCAGKNNKLINCEFRRCNAPVFFYDEKMLIENCLFEDIEWDVNSNGASGSVILGQGSTIRRCTVTRTGNSEGIRPIKTHSTVQLNRLSDMGNLQHDGAGINVGTTKHKGALVEKNWVYDSNRQGVRFDYHGTNIHQQDGSVYGDGIYRNNVTWNTQPNQVKGDRQLILNNTVINCNRYKDPATEEFNMSVQGFKAMHEILGNAHSVTRNNLANLTHRSWNLDNGKRKWYTRKDGYKVPLAQIIPGVHDHNNREAGAAYKYLRDPKNYDFRPKASSALVDAGAEVKSEEIKSPFISYTALAHVGAAPDIGAYEYGAKNYWIPGRQEAAASMPIPRHGGGEVPLDADLMFLGAYKADRHYLYLGESESSLVCVAELKQRNIFNPENLSSGKTYFWRVDAYVNGSYQKGKTWSFTTIEKSDLSEAP